MDPLESCKHRVNAHHQSRKSPSAALSSPTINSMVASGMPWQSTGTHPVALK